MSVTCGVLMMPVGCARCLGFHPTCTIRSAVVSPEPPADASAFDIADATAAWGPNVRLILVAWPPWSSHAHARASPTSSRGTRVGPRVPLDHGRWARPRDLHDRRGRL